MREQPFAGLAALAVRVAIFVLLALGLIGSRSVMLPQRTIAVPFPALVYQIHAKALLPDGSTHVASLLNLEVGQPGVPVVPTPVDVDGDLLPDVLVSVNLVDLSVQELFDADLFEEGLLDERLLDGDSELGVQVAPTIRIDRHPSAVLFNQPSRPLSIAVQEVIDDLEGGPETVLRFGYDAGCGALPWTDNPSTDPVEDPCTGDHGGSIPPSFEATVGGLADFFNPLEAVIDTKGANLAGDDSPKVWYEGPLDVLFSVGRTEGNLLPTIVTERHPQLASSLDARLAYDPWPDIVRVRYEDGEVDGRGDGHHIDYAHGSELTEEINLGYGIFHDNGDANTPPPHVPYVPGEFPEVDLTASLELTDEVAHTSVVTRIDRLPETLRVDVNPDAVEGHLAYEGASDGRLPDVSANVLRRAVAGETLVASVDVTALPPTMSASWSLPEPGPSRLDFDASGQGLGAVEAVVQNFEGEREDALAVPSERQYALLSEAGDQLFVAARLEGVRGFGFAENADGFVADARIGDGVLPLEVQVSSDRILEEHHLEVRGVISPLPHELHLDVSTPEAPQPTKVIYEASEAVDADLDFRKTPRSIESADCGDPGALCALLEARHLPTSLEARIVDAGPDSRVEVDSDSVGAGVTSLSVDVTITDDHGDPLVAAADAIGLPDHLRLRIEEDATENLEHAEFHACDRDFETGACRPGTEGALKSLTFNVRNFVEADRPAGLTVPVLDRRNHVAAVADGSGPDGVRFEAAGRFRQVREVQYLAEEATGVRARVDDGGMLRGQVDLRDIDPDPDNPNDEIMDLTATVDVPALPGVLELCFRDQGESLLGEATHAITAPCETSEPFGSDLTLEGSALSVGYRAGRPVDIHGTVHSRNQGRTTFTATDEVDDDTVVDATLYAVDLPADMTVYLFLPVENEDAPDGPSDVVRARFVSGASPTSVSFSARTALGDAVCKDPRPGATVTCVAGTLTNLPTEAELFFDDSLTPSGPAEIGADDHNFLLTTIGGADTELVDFDFSSVKPDPDADPPASSVTTVEGALRGIPATVAGKLRMPQEHITDDEPVISIVAEPALGEADLVVRNYLPPEVFGPVGEPHRVPETPFDGEVTVQVEGSRTRAALRVTDLERVGYRTARDRNDSPLDTKVVSLGFTGPPKTARVYADIAKPIDPDGPSAVEQTLADIVLEDLPSEIDLCVRGERSGDTAEPTEQSATWCDTVADNEGAFRVETPGDGAALDVDAVTRIQKAGGSELLAGRLILTDLPPIVQATLPVGDDICDGPDGPCTAAALDIQGLTADGTATGIGQSTAEFASGYDLENDGWTDTTRPYHDRRRPLPTHQGSPFPAPTTDNQHVSAALGDGHIHVRARIGDATGATPGSRLERLRLLGEPCDPPPNNPPDYPYFPTADASDSMCVAAGFADGDGGDPDPLDLSLADGFGPGEVLRLHDAGLTDIPSWFQLTLSETSTTEGANEELRRRCGPAASETADANCMAPLIRFDQPQADIDVFGMLDTGDARLLAGGPDSVFSAVDPTDPAPDFDAVPDPTGDNPWADQWGTDPHGIRAKLLEKIDAVVGGEDGVTFVAVGASAARIGFLLPLPQSLTVEQPQSWTMDLADSEGSSAQAATDVRFAFAVRDGAGNPIDRLGELAVFVRDGDQELLLGRDATTEAPTARDEPDLTRGAPLPGELALDLYQRASDRQGRTFYQLDGRVSQPFNAGVRLFDRAARPNPLPDDITTIERMAFELRNAPATEPDTPEGTPSFRLRLEMLGEPDLPPGGGDTAPASSARTRTQLIGTLQAALDFAPDSVPARLIEGVVLMDVPAIGAELAGFADLDTPSPSRTPAEISADGAIFFDPFNVRLTDGGLRIQFESRLEVDLSIDSAEDFILRNNLVRLNPTVLGSSSSALLGPIEWTIDHFQLKQDLGELLDVVVGDLTVFFLPCLEDDFAGFEDYGCNDVPPVAPIDSNFYDCEVPTAPEGPHPIPGIGPTGGTGRSILDGLTISSDEEWSGTVIVIDDPVSLADDHPLARRFRVILPSVVGLSPDQAATEVVDVFCDLDPGSYELIHQSVPNRPALHPGDPLGVEGHDVPPAGVASPPVSTERVFAELSRADPPDVSIAGSPRWCGVHRFGGLTITGAVNVSDESIDTPALAGESSLGPACPAGAEGRLVLIADEIVVDGWIDADAVISTPPDGVAGPTGTSGAGHRAEGGTGGEGTAGEAFGDLTPGSTQTEPGAPGAGPSGGKGGGLIALVANTIDINGEVSANGGPGGPGSCTPGSETPGSGGGSGGGISLQALHIDAEANSLAALGGDGSEGINGGGGGAGGVVKIHSPDYDGPTPAVAFGQGGGSCGAGFTGGNGRSGRDPDDFVIGTVVSHATGVATESAPVTTGWSDTREDIKVGYEYLLPEDPPLVEDGKTFLFVCSVIRDELEQTFTMPEPAGGLNAPCGTAPTRGSIQLSTRAGSAEAATSALQTTVPDDGVHGIFTHTCTSYDSGPPLVGTVILCHEPIPARPDLVIGVDTASPEAAVTPADDLLGARSETTNAGISSSAGRNVRLNISVVAPGSAESPIDRDRVVCNWRAPGEATGSPFACSTGGTTFEFREGVNRFFVQAHDLAGNVGESFVDVIVDETVPSAAAVVSPPNGADGWHRPIPTEPPISVEVLVSDAESGLADTPLVFSIDGGTEQSVPTGDCTSVGGSGHRLLCPVHSGQLARLAVGVHEIRFSAVDLVGNRLHGDAMPAVTLKIDNKAPVTHLATVSFDPDGNSDWFVSRPFAVVSARDQLGGAGVAESKLSINGAEEDYTGPRLLPAGFSEVCAWSTDVAGNEETRICRDVMIDLADPSTTITSPPPDGGEWHLIEPTVSVDADDLLAGIAPDFGGADDPCLLQSEPLAASGVCVSIDGAAFAPYAGPFVLPEGEHDVRAFSVDRAGRRSDLAQQTVLVDLSDPVLSIRTFPEKPRRNGWFDRPPTVHVSAVDGDENAGRSGLEHRIGSGAFTAYRTPFTVPAGTHTLEVRATDPAGRSRLTTVDLRVDNTPVAVRPLRPLPGDIVQVFWEVENRSGQVENVDVQVFVFRETGDLGARIVHREQVAVPPGGTVRDHTLWTGDVTGSLRPAEPGIYYFRVMTIDEAGNRSFSGESHPLIFRL